MKPIYYTKIYFETTIAIGLYRLNIMINVISKELSYEKLDSRDKVVENYAKKLTNADIEELLPYINALDFEPYRDIEDSMGDKGYNGYRDECAVKFIGVTDSYLPLYQHDMPFFYDEPYMRPYEKLYKYVMNKYFKQ